ncbi:MAG: hypothetical protein ACJA2S_005613 [Cyclobacteriaceae bacterium]|jgi:hypothetical protein
MDEKIKDAIELLNNSKSKKRESGAKRLRKLASPLAGQELLKTLENEVLDTRTWSTQYHLILALGHSNYQPALTFLTELAKKEIDATILYMGLGDSIFRLSILSSSIESSLDLIHSFNNYRLTYGAYQALAILRLVPEDISIKEIIRIGSDPKGAEIVKGHPNDKTGLRKWVASASAGWKDELKTDFLNECEEIKDQHLTMAVESARKGEYVKWSPY